MALCAASGAEAMFLTWENKLLAIGYDVNVGIVLEIYSKADGFDFAIYIIITIRGLLDPFIQRS